MAFNITLRPSSLLFEAADDSTILAAADKAGIALAYGCRGGSCGTCKGKVLEGNIERGIDDLFALTEAERAAGWVLLCTAKVRSDAVIEVAAAVRTANIVVKTLSARIDSLEHVAPNVLIIMLSLPTTESFDFRAGQYITLLFKGGERRDFSLANAPHETGQVQLHIRLAEGSLSTRMFTEVLKKGDILDFEGPIGAFQLNPDSTKPIIMLAGSTGFAPIKSILDDMAHRGVRRGVHLYRGARNRAELYLPQLAEHWSQAIPDFTHVPVLSDPTPECEWHGRSGLVHEAVLQDFADLSAFEVYACGAVAMLEAARHDFIAHGLPHEAFFADAFTAAPAKQ
ncbi:MAG: 2Fe-2S iron-sulfur cluster-binding protein [Georgfuchsia sp.]